tara:strand:- start:7 stop:501 length:495 start_codon:yes stop_codon:yes gene_type:complete
MTPKELLNHVKNEPNLLVLLLNTINQLKIDNGYEQDLLTPGFLKEWLVSDILGHDCHKTKHGPDAYSKDGKEKYEYLSCKEGGSFQLDRIHEGNLHRITRNDSFYFAQFDKKNGLECKKIWKGQTSAVLEESIKKISKMKESSKHIGFPTKWVEDNCVLVYEKQ